MKKLLILMYVCLFAGSLALAHSNPDILKEMIECADGEPT